MTSCYCDYDAPEFYVKDTRRARKEYRCAECQCKIQKGEEHEHVAAKWEGEVSSIRTCKLCVTLRDWVVGNVPCACWSHGDMIEGLQSSIDDAVYRAPDETKGLAFGFLRRRYNWQKATRNKRLETEPHLRYAP